jgi:ribosomal protein L12E/L44/L45/RPP1/RPP2
LRRNDGRLREGANFAKHMRRSERVALSEVALETSYAPVARSCAQAARLKMQQAAREDTEEDEEEDEDEDEAEEEDLKSSERDYDTEEFDPSF